MRGVPRLGRFETQVRVVLVLAVVLLAILDVMNLVMLAGARDALEESERRRAESAGREVATAVGAATIVAAAGTSSAAASDLEGELKRAARQFEFDRLAILDPAGRERAASAHGTPRRALDATLDPASREALSSGRTVATGLAPAGGGDDGSLTAFVPVLDAAGKLAAIVEARHPAPELGRLEKRLRVVVVVQIAVLMAVAGTALAFARWISRPYRVLVAAAGEAGLTRAPTPAATGADDLAEAFRAVAAKLHDQVEALGAAEREGGGLGDLARFASGPAAGMSTGVLVVDRRGRVAAMNPAAAALLGARSGAEGAAELREAGASVAGLHDLVRACLEQGRGASREVLTFRSRDGRDGHLGIAVSLAAGYGGSPSGALILMTDLTEIRQVQAQARLRENLASVGQLAAGIAHEVRNALGTILGWARMLDKREDPRVRGPAGEILKEVDAVRAVLDEFLLYARPPEPQRAPIALEPVVRACAAAAPAGVTVEIAGSFGTVSGDESLLRRAFGNLLQNAADASPGREVHVRISGKPAGSGRTTLIDVEDDGPGIPAEAREHVFVPFFTTRARGTGLGLALVQRTLVDMGGTVEALEGPRGGALFRIRLPLVPADSDAAGNEGSISGSV